MNSGTPVHNLLDYARDAKSNAWSICNQTCHIVNRLLLTGYSGYTRYRFEVTHSAAVSKGRARAIGGPITKGKATSLQGSCVVVTKL